jgi:hypothetical protein
MGDRTTREASMHLRLAGLALGAAMVLAGVARAEPEVLVKCDGVGPGQHFTNTGGWQVYPNPDRSVTITRDKGKFSIEVAGEAPYSTLLVFPTPMQHIEKFRVMGHDGKETFYLVTGANSGKTELKHQLFGGKDGSHQFNIRVHTLDHCTTVSPDVAVGKEGAISTKE